MKTILPAHSAELVKLHFADDDQKNWKNVLNREFNNLQYPATSQVECQLLNRAHGERIAQLSYNRQEERDRLASKIKPLQYENTNAKQSLYDLDFQPYNAWIQNLRTRRQLTKDLSQQLIDLYEGQRRAMKLIQTAAKGAKKKVSFISRG